MSSDLEKFATSYRSLLKNLINARISTKKDRVQLARAIGKSESYIMAMIYQGKASLDAWVMALAHCYSLNMDILVRLREVLTENIDVSEGDKVWMSLKTDLHATEEELLYLSRCAYEALRVKKEIQAEKEKTNGELN